MTSTNKSSSEPTPPVHIAAKELQAVADGLPVPTRQRWKVLVVGASMPAVVAPGRRSRQDGTYVEVLEWLLRDAGYDVTVESSSRAFDQIHQGARRLIETEWDRFPDVLIFHFGFNECRPRVVPWAFIRHLYREYHNLSAPARAYQRLVVPHLWKFNRTFQGKASAWVGMRTSRMSAERYRQELARVVKWARREKMLVLAPEVNPPGKRIATFVPSLEERCARHRELQAEVVASFADPDVRIVPTANIIEEFGIVDALPDSLHFSAPAHRRFAETLAEQITPWLDEQRALCHGGRRGAD